MGRAIDSLSKAEAIRRFLPLVNDPCNDNELNSNYDSMISSSVVSPGGGGGGGDVGGRCECYPPGL